MRAYFLGTKRRRISTFAAAGVILAGAAFAISQRGLRPMKADGGPDAVKARAKPVAIHAEPGVVHLDAARREAIHLKTTVTTGAASSQVIQVPGQVGPDETKYAFITPRASGVVRFVATHEGQQVKTGDLLAMIDSPDLAQARFDLYTQNQELEIAQSQAEWQEVVYKNTLALLERLEAGDSPEEIDRLFEDRPVGTNRERLISVYAARRLAKVTYDRNTELFGQKVISAQQYQKVRAEFESAEAAYQSLTEQMRYSARLTNTQAQQNLRKAETAQRVARSRLRMLGVSPDGSVSDIVNGKVVGVNPDGTLSVPAPSETAAATEPPAVADRAPVTPVGAQSEADPISGSAGHPTIKPADRPVSSYPIWAPFDGTIIDRMMVVPGVYVDTTHRVFTLADLSTVWVEAHIHETNYGAMIRGKNAKLRFTSPAYPGETFEAEILYSGDLVDNKTRALRLMARAQNPDRRLKPGMYVEIEIVIPEGREVVLAPSSAVLTEGDQQVMFVMLDEGRYERRPVKIGATRGPNVEIVEGVKAGESVVTDGAFKLKAELSLEKSEEETAG